MGGVSNSSNPSKCQVKWLDLCTLMQLMFCFFGIPTPRSSTDTGYPCDWPWQVRVRDCVFFHIFFGWRVNHPDNGWIVTGVQPWDDHQSLVLWTKLEHGCYDLPNSWDDDPIWRTHIFQGGRYTMVYHQLDQPSLGSVKFCWSVIPK